MQYGGNLKGAPSPKQAGAASAPRKGNKGLSELINMVNTANRGSFFKLKPNGAVRIRLLQPIVSAQVAAENPRAGLPIAQSLLHWIPIVKQDGTPGRGKVICPSVVGEPCPLCVLHTILADYRHVAVLNDLWDRQAGQGIGQIMQFMAWVIDRSYLLGNDAEYRPELDKPQEIALPRTVVTAMAEFMNPESGGWGDASDPNEGFDFVVKGTAPGGNISRTRYSVMAVMPQQSPAYSMKIMSGLPSQYQRVENQLSTPEDLQKTLEVLLAGIQQSSPEGEECVARFLQEWDTISGYEGEEGEPEPEAEYEDEPGSDDNGPESLRENAEFEREVEKNESGEEYGELETDDGEEYEPPKSPAPRKAPAPNQAAVRSKGAAAGANAAQTAAPAPAQPKMAPGASATAKPPALKPVAQAPVKPVAPVKQAPAEKPVTAQDKNTLDRLRSLRGAASNKAAE